MKAAISMMGGVVPERTCVGCGRKRGQAKLVRFRGGRTGLRVDLERGEGRGAYLCPDVTCLEVTVKRKALQRALGPDIGPLSVEGLCEAIHQAVLQKVQRLLGLARRARRIAEGSRAVVQALEASRVQLLLLDQDMVPPVRKQIEEEAERQGVPVVTVFSWKDLKAALGGPLHEAIGLLDGECAEGVLRSLRFWIPAGDGERSLRQEGERRTGGGRRG